MKIKPNLWVLKTLLLVVLLLVPKVLQAQYITIDEATNKVVKKAGKSGFFVNMIKDDKNPLLYKVLVDNTTQEPIFAYLRTRKSADFIEHKKAILKDSKVILNLDVAALEDGEYTFVIKTNSQFYIKHFLLTSGDLVCEKVGGKESLIIDRNMQIIED
ncbi:hypothetical protein [Flectobacillus major]|uniref:hypothetical protein n=1 Tax=Flectobacillus major TaxID=103 RepID=UPI00041390EF|nr:hypothetical protein [Flectobacillus major]